MFAPGSATVQPASKPLLSRIGQALGGEAGKVRVIGYTDDQAIRTIAFPSNAQLSAARAQAASAIIAAGIGDASRVSFEGRADAEPIATNATPEGRERNRRIEIVLSRQGP
jgi:type VI secretion system protein ImpK